MALHRVCLQASTLAVLFSFGSPVGAAQAGTNECVTAHADAQLLRMQGSLVKAREKLLVCAQTECPKPVANDCAAWLSEVEDSLSSIVFAVSDEEGHDLTDVRIRANGRPLADHADGRALTIDPGSYALRFESAGYLPVEQTISIRQSEKNRILRVRMARANPPPSAAKRTPPHTPILTPVEAPADTPASSAIPLASYVLAGSTLLGFGAYAYFGLSGLAKERKYQRLEDPEMCDFCSSGERDYVLANIGLGVGLASAVGAVAVFFLSRPDQKPVDQRAGLQVLPAGLQWSERF